MSKKINVSERFSKGAEILWEKAFGFLVIAALVIAFFPSAAPIRSWVLGAMRGFAVKHFSADPPDGAYAPVRIRNSRLDHRGFLTDDAYVVTLSGDSHSKPVSDVQTEGLSADSGLLYTLECVPRIWNRCAQLVPDSRYYARWTTSEHKQLAIGIAATEPPKSPILSETIRFYDVVGWNSEAEVSFPGYDENQFPEVKHPEAIVVTPEDMKNAGVASPADKPPVKGKH